MKLRSTIYYNRVLSLKVSSKFEFSKNSFLQTLKEMEAVSDYLLNNPDPFDKNLYLEGEKHNQNFGLFLIKTFDSNVCSAASEKYADVTRMCKSVQSMTNKNRNIKRE